MTKVRDAQSEHNASISISMTALLQSYRASFIAGQEYMESIQPSINAFISYAENVKIFSKISIFQFLVEFNFFSFYLFKREVERKRDKGNAKKLIDSQLDSSSSLKHDKQKKTGKKIKKKKGRGRGKKDFDEEDFEIDEVEEKEIELLEDGDSISFDCDPKTNEKEVRAADVPNLVRHLTHPTHSGKFFIIMIHYLLLFLQYIIIIKIFRFVMLFF